MDVFESLESEVKGQKWIETLDPEGRYGYLIEFTSHTPKELHDRNNDLPPLPEPLMPQKVSPFNAKHFDGEIPSDKLISHVGIKNHIVNHFMEIQEAINKEK